jgi:hypothetical protein
MTDEERIDDAYVRIDIDTDEILAFYDGERVERCLKSIWDSTVTMYETATVALKENAKLRELIQRTWKWERNGCYECPLEEDCKVLCVYDGDCGMAVGIERDLQELGVEVSPDRRG